MHFFSIHLFGILFLSSSATAQLVQVPDLPGFGNGNNGIPFANCCPMGYQQIYSASAFTQGGIIDKLKFRYDEETGGAFGPLNMDLQIAFAYAATTVSTASPILANNIGDDFTVVLDGTITGSTDSSPPTMEFELVIDVANSFTYDPTRGDLLLQILKRDFNHFDSIDASGYSQQNVTTRI
jgi:hypothetical protein